jgi:ABC-type uncharacterized transport system involved in gliding motility auxiliary subunit
MKKNLLPLPFLAVLVAALAPALSNSFKDKPVFGIIAWTVAGLLLVAWVALDQKNLVNYFFLRKGARYGASSSLAIALVLAIVTGIAMLSSKPRFNKTYDATKSGINTLSDQSVKTLKALKQKQIEPELVAIFQEEQQKTKFKDLLALYQAQGLVTHDSWIDPQTEPTKAMAEKVSQANTAILRFGSQEARLTTFNEEKLTNALANLTREHAKKIYFIKGHGEGDISNSEAQGFARVTEELRNNKQEVQELSLLESAKVPDDANLLVIAGPKYDFKSEEIKVLDEYTSRGKPLLVMVDALVPVPVLNQFLSTYGLKFHDDLLILRPDDPRAQLLGQNNAIVTDFDRFSQVTKDFSSQSAVALLMPTTRSIEEITENARGMKVSLVAKTSEAIVQIDNVRSEKDLKALSSDRILTGKFGVVAVANGRIGGAELAKNDAPPKAKPDSGNSGPPDLAKELRIVAVGSSQLASNFGLQRSENLDMFMNSVNYLLQDEDFISIRPKDPLKTTIDLTTPGSQLGLIFLCFIYPFVFLATGLFSWMRRRSA